MEYQKFVDALFEHGKENGFDAMEVYFQKNAQFETTVFKTEVDKFSISDTQGLSFRGIIGGKMGYAYTEILDESAITMLVEEAKTNAAVIESEDEVFIAEPAEGYKAIEAYNPNLGEISKVDKIAFLKEVEKEVMALDDRIQSLAYNLYMDFETEVAIQNTKGLDLKQKTNLAVAMIMPLAVENGENKTSYVLLMDRDFKAFDAKKTAKEVVEKTTNLLGAKTVASKSYPVILKNECSASLLAAFTSVFNAEIVQKDLSMMKGLIGNKVAADCVTIVDNPFMEGGFGNIGFDAEGTPSQSTTVIKDGELKSYLHNLKTAKKDGVESTGNAAKGSYKASVNVAPSNFYIEPGQKDLDALMSGIEEGVMITKLDGIHSGLNTISGDFSLAAIGYLIKNGKIDRPIDQITVAGNLKELLMEVEEVGNDMTFGFPQGSAFVAAPSLKIEKLAIAGE
jgi:PmbA protein